MSPDLQVRRPTRRCAVTDREFAPGETFYSALVDDGSQTTRTDVSVEAWEKPPEGTIAWWRAARPTRPGDGSVPTEALLRLLDEWADRPDEATTRYVLALLLVRRRVLRPMDDGVGGLFGDAPDSETSSAPTLTLLPPGADEPIEVAIVQPSAEQITAAQARLHELMGAA